LIILFLVISIHTILNVYNDFTKKISLTYDQNDWKKKKSKNGEQFWGHPDDDRKENGVYISRFIALNEIQSEWNKKRKVRLDSSNNNEQLNITLFRFLSSKGLQKDSAAVADLSEKEVQAIENGVANVYYLNHNKFQNRIHKTFYELKEYNRNGNASGYSLALRLEYWKTSINIIANNFLLGVGTGDIKNTFEKNYIKSDSKIDLEYRKRGHNQYLTFFATFGLFGIILFLTFLHLPLRNEIPFRPIYLFIWGILCLSFLTEDTLETQAGVTLFAFFNSLFLVGIGSNQIDE